VTAHLLLFTIGPVQDFIAQARRTRDLWYGSHLLSELSRAAARALLDAGAELVFPALARDNKELTPCFTPLRGNDLPPLNIANRLLAEVPDGDPEAVARKVREAVKQCWRDDIAARVRDACRGILAEGIDSAWDEQIDTFLEFAAAWAPLGDYAEARRSLDRAVAARKALRDFEPWRRLRGGVPKSSLDGARETVLVRPETRNKRLVKRYRITIGEQLDAVGLVKRAGGDPRLGDDDEVDVHDIQFVPVVNVALAHWASVAAREAPALFALLKDVCKHLKLPRVRREIPCAKEFPFNAMVFLRSRWAAVFEELGLQADPERWGRTHVVPLLEVLSEPYPYVACLVADGDHMGRAIERLDEVNAHREFSRALSGFAEDARRIVEQEHLGSLVYAGGDDVLAFLPLSKALACADALRRGFAHVMAMACPDLPEAERPTLSVGIGVGHIMESMGELLSIGRKAEELAKGGALAKEKLDRNALAVVVDKRSGGQISWRAQWKEWDGDPAARLERDAALLDKQLSSSKVHEIARTLARLPKPGGTNGGGWSRVIALEVRRSLARAHAGEPALELEGIELSEQLGLKLDENAEYATLHREVGAWVARMLVARTFAAAAAKPRHAQRTEKETR
jgi:CRISPR-associated protein Cmr2